MVEEAEESRAFLLGPERPMPLSFPTSSSFVTTFQLKV